MRVLKAAIGAAGAVRKEMPSAREELVTALALRRAIRPALVPDDVRLCERLLEGLFPEVYEPQAPIQVDDAMGAVKATSARGAVGVIDAGAADAIGRRATMEDSHVLT